MENNGVAEKSRKRERDNTGDVNFDEMRAFISIWLELSRSCFSSNEKEIFSADNAANAFQGYLTHACLMQRLEPVARAVATPHSQIHVASQDEVFSPSTGQCVLENSAYEPIFRTFSECFEGTPEIRIPAGSSPWLSCSENEFTDLATSYSESVPSKENLFRCYDGAPLAALVEPENFFTGMHPIMPLTDPSRTLAIWRSVNGPPLQERSIFFPQDGPLWNVRGRADLSELPRWLALDVRSGGFDGEVVVMWFSQIDGSPTEVRPPYFGTYNSRWQHAPSLLGTSASIPVSSQASLSQGHSWPLDARKRLARERPMIFAEENASISDANDWEGGDEEWGLDESASVSSTSEHTPLTDAGVLEFANGLPVDEEEAAAEAEELQENQARREALVQHKVPVVRGPFSGYKRIVNHPFQRGFDFFEQLARPRDKFGSYEVFINRNAWMWTSSNLLGRQLLPTFALSCKAYLARALDVPLNETSQPMTLEEKVSPQITQLANVVPSPATVSCTQNESANVTPSPAPPMETILLTDRRSLEPEDARLATIVDEEKITKGDTDCYEMIFTDEVLEREFESISAIVQAMQGTCIFKIARWLRGQRPALRRVPLSRLIQTLKGFCCRTRKGPWGPRADADWTALQALRVPCPIEIRATALKAEAEQKRRMRSESKNDYSSTNLTQTEQIQRLSDDSVPLSLFVQEK